MPMHPEKTKNFKNQNVLRRGFAATALASIALAGTAENAKAEIVPIGTFLPQVITELEHEAKGHKSKASSFLIEPFSAERPVEKKPPRKQILAREILRNDNVTFWDNGVDAEVSFQRLAEGKNAPITCGPHAGETSDITKPILKFVLNTAEHGGIMVNATTDKCHSDDSNHYPGTAIDTDCGSEVSFEVQQQEAEKLGGQSNGEICGSASHNHFDF